MQTALSGRRHHRDRIGAGHPGRRGGRSAGWEPTLVLNYRTDGDFAEQVVELTGGAGYAAYVVLDECEPTPVPSDVTDEQAWTCANPGGRTVHA